MTKPDKAKIICVVCPQGCQLEVSRKGKTIQANGYKCRSGLKYAKQEFTNPQRTITTTVQIEGDCWPLLSVRSDRPVPKKLLGECMRYLAGVKVSAPVKLGDVVVSNILGTGANIIATRNCHFGLEYLLKSEMRKME